MLFYNPTGIKADYNKTDAKPTDYAPNRKRPRDTLTGARARAEAISRPDPSTPSSRLSVDSIEGDFEELAGKPAMQAPFPKSQSSPDREGDQPRYVATISATTFAPQPTSESNVQRRQPWTTLATRRRQQTDEPTFTSPSTIESIPEGIAVNKRQPQQTERETSQGTDSTELSAFGLTQLQQQESTHQRAELTGPTVIEVNPPVQTILAAPSAPGLSTLSIATIIVGSLVACIIVASMVFMCVVGRQFRLRKEKEKQKKDQEEKQARNAAEEPGPASTDGHHGVRTHSAVAVASPTGAANRGSRGARGASGATGSAAAASSGPAASPSIGASSHA